MRIFVISLSSARARRHFAAQQMQERGLTFEFFDAVTEPRGARRRFAAVDRFRFRLNARRDPLPGEIGCYASHLELWRRCVESDEPVLVLEDDFELLHGFENALPTLDTVAGYYDFLRLEPIARRRAPLKRLLPAAYEIGARDGFRIHYLSDVPTCMTAYTINPRGAKRLLSASRCLTAPVDKFLQRTWHHRTPVFALSPAIVRPAMWAAQSTIGRRAAKSRNLLLLIARAVYKLIGESQRAVFDQTQLALLDARRAAR